MAKLATLYRKTLSNLICEGKSLRPSGFKFYLYYQLVIAKFRTFCLNKKKNHLSFNDKL